MKEEVYESLVDIVGPKNVSPSSLTASSLCASFCSLRRRLAMKVCRGEGCHD